MTRDEWKKIIEISYEWYETEVSKKPPPVPKITTPIPDPTPEDIELLRNLLVRMGLLLP